MGDKENEKSDQPVSGSVQPPTGIVQPMIDELKNRQKVREPAAIPPGAPPKPAELDQDPGGGFNPDHTVPQP